MMSSTMYCIAMYMYIWPTHTLYTEHTHTSSHPHTHTYTEFYIKWAHAYFMSV